MISLADYRKYWEGLARRVGALTGVLPVTLDEQMGRKIQSLPADSLTLFVLPPVAESAGRTVDTCRETNRCVIFVMAKYDPQRRSSFEVLEQTQAVAEAIKAAMLDDQRAGCPVMRIEVAGIETAPETELYGRFAGWSIAFNVTST